MKIPPEMIDAAVIQLQSLFDAGEGIPENVCESGKKFVADLDAWSDQLKKAKAEETQV
jgi:hypothetical protein